MGDLRAIVEALGGEIWAAGQRATVRAPGHSGHDRSVSLLLSGDRLIIHAFGSTEWREISLHLRDLGLIDCSGRVIGSGSGTLATRTSSLRPDGLRRLSAARALWNEAGPLTPASASFRHLVSRVGCVGGMTPDALRHHPGAPVSVFGDSRRRRPALVARVCDARGELTAVEIVYLHLNGQVAMDLRLPRKTVGLLPAASAVRLHQPGRYLLVGEGVMTTLSASQRFGLPGWALLSARNLATWSAPPPVRHVVIAADRGAAGEAAAGVLHDRLWWQGVSAGVALPPPVYGDWNDVAVAERREEEGR